MRTRYSGLSLPSTPSGSACGCADLFLTNQSTTRTPLQKFEYWSNSGRKITLDSDIMQFQDWKMT